MIVRVCVFVFVTGEVVIVGWGLEEDVKDGGRQCGSLKGVVAVVWCCVGKVVTSSSFGELS